MDTRSCIVTIAAIIFATIVVVLMSKDNKDEQQEKYEKAVAEWVTKEKQWAKERDRLVRERDEAWRENRKLRPYKAALEKVSLDHRRQIFRKKNSFEFEYYIRHYRAVVTCRLSYSEFNGKPEGVVCTEVYDQ